ncbi:hypothetical protein BDV98DRAFT_175743 [Pterulicium gracile]|uniref:Uncharacterized protein n=1 Tax=Pterulicium gracile TaxID=1884261 RepID=A0A5C3QB11_9AGAR|nr:hypothetical protein BDV98DRAFT_175743 [Pterula gracilis]
MPSHVAKSPRRPDHRTDASGPSRFSKDVDQYAMLAARSLTAASSPKMLGAATLCSGAICGALHYTLEHLFEGGGGEDQQLKRARKKYPQLITALVSFALSHRTSDEFRDMKSVLEDCRCTPGRLPLHSWKIAAALLEDCRCTPSSTGLSLAQNNTLHNHLYDNNPTAKLPGLARVVFAYFKTLIWHLHTASLETYGQKAAQGREDRGLQRMAYFLVQDVDGTVDACIQ